MREAAQGKNQYQLKINAPPLQPNKLCHVERRTGVFPVQSRDISLIVAVILKQDYSIHLPLKKKCFCFNKKTHACTQYHIELQLFNALQSLLKQSYRIY